ncbi:MerR family transcriptional regulator [Robertmurraya massiliosenegalensis]|uniref:MerR family transcriptional regulator n=1 Tax=Robertmurraya massiliosenegalensis TaxID=1287657 RepID=UPI00030CDF4A|nr:MerR family transcriptional regulator [Robertmurraya massiliosenegalensis]
MTNKMERIEIMQTNKMVRAYSIKEVSKKINIPTGTIRQWEKDLNGLLVIPRTKQGARFFTENEINLLKKIKEMREQNVSKDMIRSLLQKHFASSSETPSETVETGLSVPDVDSTEEELQPQLSEADVYSIMDMYKQDIVNEIKQELTYNQQQITENLKSEIASSSLHSIKEISKSIQRANDKRKGELQELSSVIHHVSEQSSESFETLSEHVSLSSQDTFEKIAKKMQDASNITSREQNTNWNKVSKTVSESKRDLKRMVGTLEAKQETILNKVSELQQSTEEIRDREEAFQGMLSSYREVAAAKTKRKNWWKWW